MPIAEQLNKYYACEQNASPTTPQQIIDAGYFSDAQSEITYSDEPEFIRPIGDKIEVVNQSSYKFTDSEKSLTTHRIRACSGIILRSNDMATFGLYHASPLPFLDLQELDLEKLSAFSNGQLIEIKGTESTSKDHVFKQLKMELGIDHIGTIFTETQDSSGVNRLFHVAYRPLTNTVLVARNSHRDIQSFPAFLT